MIKEARLDIENEDFELWIELPEDGRPDAFAELSKPGGRISTSLFGKAARAFASRFSEDLRLLADPDELSIEFGLTASGGSKFIVGASGTVKIGLKWKKEPPE